MWANSKINRHTIHIVYDTYTNTSHLITEDLYEFLTKHSIPTSHYALRWSLCFMLREFPLRDSVVIWDSLISHPQGGFSSFIQYLAANYILQFSEFIMAMSIESLLFFFNSVPIIWDEDGIKDFIEDSKTLQLAYRQFLIDNTNNLGTGEGEGYEMEDVSETSHTQTGEPTPLDQEFFDYYF